jgi:hypothetical protein
MDGPFIIRARSRIRPGMTAAYKPLAKEICRLVEEREPRVLAFNIWVDEAEDSEVVLQVHPDAASLELHLELLGEKVRSTFEYADFESLEVYGPPSETLRTLFEAQAGTVQVTFYPIHWGGFTRLLDAAT